MTICERIFEIMELKQLKPAELAKKLKIQQSVLSNWKKRNTNPPVEYTVVICEFLEVSLHYLLTGKEENDLTPEELKILEAYRTAPPGMKEATKKLLDVKNIYSDDMGKFL